MGSVAVKNSVTETRVRQRKLFSLITAASVGLMVGLSPAAAQAADPIDTNTAFVNLDIATGWVKFSNDGSEAFMVSMNDLKRYTLFFIDTATDSVIDSITDFPNGISTSFSLSPDGKTILAFDRWGDNTLVIDTATRSIVKSLAIPGYDVQFSPDGSKAYMRRPDKITVVNTATMATIRTIALPWDSYGSPKKTVFTQDGTRAYVSNYERGEIYVIDVATSTLVKTITGFDPLSISELVINPTGTQLLAGGLRQISVLDLPGETIGTPIKVRGDGPQAGADHFRFSNDGTELYLSENTATVGVRELVVVDAATYAVKRVIPTVGNRIVNNIDISPDNTKAYGATPDNSNGRAGGFLVFGTTVPVADTASYNVSTGNVVVGGTHTITETLVDSANAPVTGKQTLLKASTTYDLGTGHISDFTETTPGTYTATVTSSIPGAKEITATYDGTNATLNGNGTANFIAASVIKTDEDPIVPKDASEQATPIQTPTQAQASLALTGSDTQQGWLFAAIAMLLSGGGATVIIRRKKNA